MRQLIVQLIPRPVHPGAHLQLPRFLFSVSHYLVEPRYFVGSLVDEFFSVSRDDILLVLNNSVHLSEREVNALYEFIFVVHVYPLFNVVDGVR